jgi:hypothetical protein
LQLLLKEANMSKLGILALSAAMTVAWAQTPPPTTPTTGANTTGTSNAGATVPEQRQPTRAAKPTTAKTPATGANTTGTGNTGATAKVAKQGSRSHKQHHRSKSASSQER